jgi:NAD+ kinase
MPDANQPEIRPVLVKQAGIFSKPNVSSASSLVPWLVEWLAERKVEVRYDEITAEYLGRGDGLPREVVPEGCELVIVLGGDGTLLSAARAIDGREIPLFAVNVGGLGFLTAITVDDLFPELERALRGERRVSLRRMLHVDLFREDRRVAQYEALNDAVLNKAAIARIMDIDVFASSRLVCAYKADGLIVSTPTGSTAYSLSAGGPVIYPTVGALCLTPICPHTLTNRPLIVPAEMTLTLINRADDQDAYLTIDGQVGEPLMKNDRMECRISEHALHLIRPPKTMFFDVLRQKLKWGQR